MTESVPLMGSRLLKTDHFGRSNHGEFEWNWQSVLISRSAITWAVA
jgi:hypothetical protein